MTLSKPYAPFLRTLFCTLVYLLRITITKLEQCIFHCKDIRIIQKYFLTLNHVNERFNRCFCFPSSFTKSLTYELLKLTVFSFVTKISSVKKFPKLRNSLLLMFTTFQKNGGDFLPYQFRNQ